VVLDLRQFAQGGAVSDWRARLPGDHDPGMSTPDDDLVLLAISDRIATVTLNRPEARNALSRALQARLRTVMADAEASDDADVIILTGADPAFSAGLDLKELGGGAPLNIGTGTAANPDLPKTPWARTTKPVIGAINGVAITGGFELALQCDFLVASERAAFGDTHARVGVLPGWGLSVLLPQAVGYRRSLEMSMTGNFMLADEALAFGLVNHVVPHDQLMDTARQLASDIARNNTPAIRTLLASYRAIHEMTVGQGLRHETKVNREYMSTFKASDLEARRDAIMQRGRGQVS